MHISKTLLPLAIGWVMVLASACGGSGGGQGAASGPQPKPKVPAKSLPAEFYDQVIKQGVPADAARMLIANYEEHRFDISNDAWVSVIDFRIHSKFPRLFVINAKTAEVDAIHVAHGTGSDHENDGVPKFFSNVPNSKRSSLGSYLISEKYYGKYGAAMKTDGLDRQNSLVRERNIVMHGSNYVKDGRSKQGLSWGCPAVPFAWMSQLIDRLRDGSFMYAVGDNQLNAAWDMQEAERVLMDPMFQWLDESEDAPFEGE
jgi:hypothetical protein